MPRKKEIWGDAVGTAPWAAVLRPAPGDLRILQALLNTADAVAGTDELSGPRGLADWMARWGLAAAGPEIGAAELERAIAVREGLRALARVNVGLPHFSRNGKGRWCVVRCANLIKSRIYRRKNPEGRWPSLRKARSS